jgi:hypothetical protein
MVIDFEALLKTQKCFVFPLPIESETLQWIEKWFVSLEGMGRGTGPRRD